MTTRVTTLNLPAFSRQLLGIDHLLRSFESNPIKFPLMNILKHGNQYRIDFALAGFDKSDIEVLVENDQLTIRTKDAYKQSDPRLMDDLDSDYDESEQICLYKDISYRPFIRTFRLIEHLIVKEVTMKNGLLSVHLELELPEKLKPRSFQIENK